MNQPSLPLAQLLAVAASAGATPSGDAAQRAAAIRVDRACTELRRGRPLLVAGPSADLGASAADTGATRAGVWAVGIEALSEPLLRTIMASGQAPLLLLSTQRLRALGWTHASTPRTFALPSGMGLLPLQQLAAVSAGPGDPALLGTGSVAGADEQALLSLCKRARMVPALLLLPLDADAAADSAQLLRFDPADVALATPPGPAVLRRVSDARVPLSAETDCRLVLFREVDGDAEHVAILIGSPGADEPVPVRLHSACLTGDLLGSLRCDCGPQLQQAVSRLAETGGVLLYLAQEGRGTGLANKLRAYRLQDAGLDTMQADRHLGFEEDERDFSAAATMLHALGHPRIHLLTNNPQKIAALRQAGVDVVERWALPGPVNAHNAQYMHTKQQAGHLGSD